MKTRHAGKRGKTGEFSAAPIAPRSLKMLDQSVPNLRRGIASDPVALPRKRVRLGRLKGWMEIKGDIIHSEMEGDWEMR